MSGSVLREIRDLQAAAELMRLGARMQMIQSLVGVSRNKLLKLHLEVCGEGPRKGMLPYSSDWYVVFRPRIHASLWMNIYNDLSAEPDEITRILKAHTRYLEHCSLRKAEPIMHITRAWNMLSLFRAGTFSLKACAKCNGDFLVYTMDLNNGFVCGICNPPSHTTGIEAGMTLSKSDSYKALENAHVSLANRSNADCDCWRRAGRGAVRA